MDSLAVAYSPLDPRELRRRVARHLCTEPSAFGTVPVPQFPDSGAMVPELPLALAGGSGALRLSRLPGHGHVIVHFWMTWCAACFAGEDSLIALGRGAGGHQLRTASVIMAQRVDAGGAVSPAAGGRHIVLLADSAFRQAARLTALPVVIVLDPAGRVVDRCTACTSAPSAFARVRAMLMRAGVLDSQTAAMARE